MVNFMIKDNKKDLYSDWEHLISGLALRHGYLIQTRYEATVYDTETNIHYCGVEEEGWMWESCHFILSEAIVDSISDFILVL